MRSIVCFLNLRVKGNWSKNAQGMTRSNIRIADLVDEYTGDIQIFIFDDGVTLNGSGKWWFGGLAQIHTLNPFFWHFGFSGRVFCSSWRSESICSSQGGRLPWQDSHHFPGEAFWQPLMLLDRRSGARPHGVSRCLWGTSTSSLLRACVFHWVLSHFDQKWESAVGAAGSFGGQLGGLYAEMWNRQWGLAFRVCVSVTQGCEKWETVQSPQTTHQLCGDKHDLFK